MATEAEASELAPDLRAMIELVAERMEAGAGRWRLSFRLEDGHLRKFWREEEGGADALVRFGHAGE